MLRMPLLVRSWSVDARFCVLGVGILLGVTTLSACRGKASVSPDEGDDCERAAGLGWPIRVFVQPGDNMNPDAQGNPLDTQLRFYQVKGSTRAGPEIALTKLWADDAAHLGEAKLAQAERVAYIGRPYSFEIQPNADATHLLTVALLRSPVGLSYQQEVALPVGYMRDACLAAVEKAPPPCLFVLVEDKQVRVGFHPPPRFDRRAIPKGACAPEAALVSPARPVSKTQD